MHENSNPVTAVVYAAKSSVDEHGSIPDQITRCREYASAQGWEIDEPPESDEAASAYSGSRGPGLQRAKTRAAELAKSGETVLLVFATDRLARGDGRQANHLVEYVLEGIKAGFRIESVTENLGGDLALVFASLYGERANADSRAKSAHTRRGIARIVREGRWHGPAPYGYRALGLREERRLVVDEAHAVVVRRIYAEYLDGAGIGLIAEGLDEDGVKPPRGNLWDRHTVANVLDQPAYVGKVKNRDDLFDGKHEPIVEEAVWLLAAAQRQERKSGTTAGRPPNGTHLLVNGLFRCGECGGRMRPRTPRGRQARYDCAEHDRTGRCSMRGVLRRDVDEPLLAYLESVVFDVEATRQAIAEEHGRRADESEALIAQAEREVSEVDAAYGRIRADYVAGRLDAEDWRSFRDDLAARRVAAEAEAGQLRARAEKMHLEAAAFDVDQEATARLASLRKAVAEDVTGAEGLGAIRAALARVFEKITLVRTPDGEIVLVPQVRRFDEIDAWVRLPDGRTVAKPKPQTLALPQEQGVTAPM
jgi:site-specific DNA recombinase